MNKTKNLEQLTNWLIYRLMLRDGFTEMEIAEILGGDN